MMRRGIARRMNVGAGVAGASAIFHLVGGAFRLWWWLLKVAGRFVVGMPLDGRPRTDATFISDGTTPNLSGSFWGRRDASWWGYLAGWKRAALRWGVIVGVVMASRYPTPATVVASVVVAVVLGSAVVVVVRRIQAYPHRRHVERVVRPVYEVVSQYIHTDPTDDPDAWLTISRDFEDDPDATVTLLLPRGLDANRQVQMKVGDVISRHVHRYLIASWNPEQVTWRKKGALPQMVDYAGHDDPVNVLRVAKRGNGEWVTVDLATETPHGFVTAPTRQGKSSVTRHASAHTRSKGALVEYLDPKSLSALDAFDGVPGVRLHTDMESMLWAFEEFYTSMLGVEKAIKAGAKIEDFPVRVMVIDEFGSFITMAQQYHKRRKKRGVEQHDLALQDQHSQIAWRGGQTRHWLVAGAHQPRLDLFGSTDVRSQYGWRIMLGQFSRSSWVTTFGYAKKMHWNSMIKGRGIVGVGESEEQMFEAQITYMDDQAARDLALSGPTPPDWYANAHLPPWVTPDVLKEADEVAGVSRLSHPGTDPGYAGSTDDHVPEDVPPEGDPGPPQRTIAVNSAGEASETSANSPEKAASDESEADSVPVDNVVPISDEIIVGIAAAAEYLGMSKTAFVRARKPDRTPIPGEKRTANDQPYWTKQALRSWASKRKNAGRQWASDQ